MRLAMRVGAILATATALQVALRPLAPSVADVAGTIGIAVAAGAAALGCGWRVSTALTRRARAGWGTAAAGAGLWFCCNATYVALPLLGLQRGVADVADWFALAASLLVPVALLLLCVPAATGAGPRLRRVLDGATVSFALFFLAWHFVLQDAFGGLPWPTMLLGLGVPALTIVSAGFAVVVLSRSRSDGGNAVSVLAGGMGVFAASSLTTVHNAAHGGPWYAYGAGGGYLAATLLMLLASRLPVPRTGADDAEYPSGPWALLPYVPVVLAFGAAVYLVTDAGSLGAVLVWALLGTVGLVLVRQFLGLRAYQRLMRDLERQRQRLAYQAAHDSLTGLANRARFTELATAELAGAGEATRTALLLVDLDGFKQVNDTLGHGAGDRLLVEVAGRLRAAVRDGGTVARLGGDEFVILAPRLAADGEAEEVGARILAHLDGPLELAGTVVRPRGSVGVAVATGPGHRLDRLLHDADLALYRAKAAGKGLVRRAA